MKKLISILISVMLLSLLAVPVLADLEEEESLQVSESETAAVLTEEEGETVDLAEEGEMVTIEEMDVPLAAVPMSFLESSNSASSQVFTSMGLVLMCVSCLGMAFVTLNRMREKT